jgi:hypothetical protein
MHEFRQERVMGTQWSLKQVLLRILIGALVLSALIAVSVFLFGDFGKTEAKLLLTTLSVSYFSITSLACAAAYEKKKPAFLSVPGMIVSIAGFLLFIPLVWAEWWDSEACVKTMAILAIFAFSFAHACLLSLVAVPKRFSWVLVAALICIFVLAAFLSGGIVFEPDEEWLARVIGIIGVLDGCASLSLPLLCKLGGKQLQGMSNQLYEQIEIVCPRCRHQVVGAMGEVMCEKCSLRLWIEVLDEPDEAVVSD